MGLKYFDIVVKYISGYTKYKCNFCDSIFAVPKDRKDEPYIECFICKAHEIKGKYEREEIKKCYKKRYLI